MRYIFLWTPYSLEEGAGLQHLKVQTVCALFLLVDSKAALSQLDNAKVKGALSCRQTSHIH